MATSGKTKTAKAVKVVKARKARATEAAVRPTAPKPPKAALDGKQRAEFELRLYVAGQTRKSMVALSNLQRICDEHLAGKFSIEVIDLLQHPELARGDQILAIPTLVRTLPVPIRKIIGDLSNTEKVLVGLDVRATT